MTVADARSWAHHRALAHADRPWEVPPGSNHVPDAWGPYHQIFDAPTYDAPWCGVELLLVAHHGGLDLPANWISVLLAQRWGEVHDRWHLIRGAAGAATQVRAGDALVIGGPGVHIEWAREDGRPDGSVSTHGGNTSPGDEGSQDDGGTVAEKLRRPAEIYGRVALHDLYPGGDGKRPRPGPVDRRPPEPQYVAEPEHGELRIWTTGPRVELLQRSLDMVDADGYFGRTTAKRVAAAGDRRRTDTHDGRVAPVDLIRALDFHGSTVRPRRLLHIGDKGGLVRRLQRGLIHAGYLEPRVDGWRQDDGDYGARTAAAVHRLKRAKNYRHDSGDVAGIRVWKVVG
jgi:hypothetical protein